MRQRRELEEGWRKQREQEAEERARAADAVRGEEMNKWGCSVDAAASQVPATRATSHEQNVTGSKRDRRLLDWLGWDGRQKHEDKQKETNIPDGPMTMPSIRMTVDEKDDLESLNPFSGNMSEAASWLLTNEYSPIFLRGHIPTDVDRGGPSFYHALQHPHWPDFRAASTPDRFEDELRFQVPWCDAFEDLVSLQHNGYMVDRDEPTRTSSAQWLNDMIKRGSLGPIMSRGLAGPRWSTEYARTVLPFNSGRQPDSIPSLQDRPTNGEGNESDNDDEDEYEFDPVLSVVDMLEQDAAMLGAESENSGSRRDGYDEVNISLMRAVLKDLRKPGVLDELRRLGFTSEAEVARYLLGHDAASVVRGFPVAPAGVILAAMRAAAATERKSNEAEQSAEVSNEGVSPQNLEYYWNQLASLQQRKGTGSLDADYMQDNSPPADQTSSLEESDAAPSFTSSSSSTSSWSCWGTDDDKKDSIVSAMTTTERRTLPDGTVETKRVLKKKFADGREKSNESVEREMSTSPNSRPVLPKPLNGGAPSAEKEDKQTQTDVQDDPRSKRSGWFWRE